MNCSRAEATQLTEAALILVHRPARHLGRVGRWGAELAPGAGDRRRDRPARPELDRTCWPTVEAVVLPQAAELPVGGLRALAAGGADQAGRRAADRRRRRAEAAADVRLRRSAHDGMAEVVTVAAAAGRGRDGRHGGRARPAGEGRRRPAAARPDPGRGDGALTLRPWDESRPAVTAELHVLAPFGSLLPDPADPTSGGDRPGSPRSEGEPVTAAHLRALLDRAGRDLPRRAAGADRGLAAPGPARRRRQPARHADPPRAGAAAAAAAAPTRTVTAAGRSWTRPAAHRQLPAHRGPAALGTRPRPALPASRLPQPGGLDRSGPRHRPRRRWARPTATTCAACAAGTTG